MVANLTSNEIETQEFYEIDAILPTLWKEDLLTDIECRYIASSDELAEKKGAVYTIIMSKPENEAIILTKAFRKLTMAIFSKINPKSVPTTSISEEKPSVFPSRNPFLNDAIIKHLFAFLPLEDLKGSRLVCRQWNSTAEICLRKRSKIHFRPNVLLPRTFMEVSKYSYPDLPFPSFAFSSDDDHSKWDISDIQQFFEKWAKNIKEVAFRFPIILTRRRNLMGKKVKISSFELTPLFINPANITSLKIGDSENSAPKKTLTISLEKFVSIKTLSLRDCSINVSATNPNNRIAPHSVNFQDVSFLRNRKLLTDFHYNDLVDFSKAINISLDPFQIIPYGVQELKFDMGAQVFNANQLHLGAITYENWSQAKGCVEFVRLNNVPFVEKNNLNIKLLNFLDCKVNLNALPQTLEILHMASGGMEIVCNEPLNLPNLKYLCIDAKDKDCLTYFSNCSNLVDLNLRTDYADRPCTLTVRDLPKSVQKMRIKKLPPLQFTDNCIFNLDTLILDGHYCFLDVKDFKEVTVHIKAKILVVVYREYIETSDIVKLVLANKQSEKILIGCRSDLHKRTPFEGSYLSEYVDKESNFYQFENSVGKSITKAEFEKYAKEGTYFPSNIFIGSDLLSNC